MSFDLSDTLDALERTPAVLDRLLRGIGPAWHDVAEGPDTWSAFEVVGHLVHGEETDWVPRGRIILEDGESREFEPFDRVAMRTRFASTPLDTLLDRFAALRRDNLATVRAWQLHDAALAKRGRHPELGPVTLHQLLATWAVHDLGHLAQIGRVMAKRYADDVGPWRAYLPVLDR